ncbi:carboxymuconolactone decarboxylase family protein [Chitinophaga flava]|uniref:Carboxymuconolactone decarboxylase n=1 Tax=Chitinophaga flava TaxID=2259036 RepID=A0A365XWS4_9BACT|nr:carboxymuconolactone decarboxylase family protein [Chitinophaga flava]RBL90660.1 carboxymuconolactone decarboxylase [Chitinophaga flava]
METRITFADTNKGFMDGLFKTGIYLRHSGLDRKLMELVHYRISQINGCAYCLDMHHKDAIHLGETEQRLHSLPAWPECPYYTEEERAVLSYAEAVNSGHVNDEVFNNLAAFYSKAKIADLTLLVASIGTWNKLNKAFRTKPGTYEIGQHDSQD